MRAYQKLSTGSNNLQLPRKIEMEFVFIIWSEFTLRFRVRVILSLRDIETAFSMTYTAYTEALNPYAPTANLSFQVFCKQCFIYTYIYI